MIKNEKFYTRAQEVRDTSTGIENGVVCRIQSEIFNNNDSLDCSCTNDTFIFAYRRASVKTVTRVLYRLGIGFTSISKNGDYFFIKNPDFIED